MLTETLILDPRRFGMGEQWDKVTQNKEMFNGKYLFLILLWERDKVGMIL